MSADLREFIIEHFRREDLLTFCRDYFRDFYEEYEGSPISKSALARDLIDHCERRDLIAALRVNLQKARPAPFAAQFGRVTVAPVLPKARDPRQVFLSYSTHDLAFAQKLAADLRAEGVPVWAAFDSIEPGESWTSAIDRGLSESGIFIVALTPDAVASQWVRAEVQFALQEQQGGHGRLIPLMVQPCSVRQLSPLLTTIQHIDFAPGYGHGLARTFQALGVQTAAERERAAAAARQRALDEQREREALAREQAEAERLRREREQAAAIARQRALDEQREREAAAQRQAEAERVQHEQAQKRQQEEASPPVATRAPIAAAPKPSPSGPVSRRAVLLGVGGLAAAGLGAIALASRPANPVATPAPTRESPTATAPVATPAPTRESPAVPAPVATPTPTRESPAVPGVELAPGVVMPFVRVPEGEFLMGSDPARDNQAAPDEQPQHTVFLSAFDIGKHEVTNAQYAVFARETNRVFTIPSGREDHPVVNVRWDDVNAFVAWLSRKTGHAFALPTEAQWEKAARGVDGRIYPWGDAWDQSKANTSAGGPGTTSAVGAYSPGGDSPYGAADMSGNVWEWTADWYDEKAYSARANEVVRDPAGPASGTGRVLRGGSWDDNQIVARAASRSRDYPLFRDYFFGFRVVRPA